jgi:hypothetical protein
MKARCQNAKRFGYAEYGGRGIAVCGEWQMFIPFMQWALANGYGDNLEIDRIDVNGNYEPLNCRWVTRHENMMNRRPSKPLGLRYTVREIELACAAIGVDPAVFLAHLPKKRLYNEAPNLTERLAHNERVRRGSKRPSYRDSERCKLLRAPSP